MIIIMGVSGCGKTTIGKRLSDRTGMPFFDADDFHPQSNIDKMSNNIPLTDSDRHPWLISLSEKIAFWDSQGGAILACSALKEQYRELLSAGNTSISWVYLSGSFELIKSRMESRNGHYMKASLLQSQFDALEVPDYGLDISIENDPEEIIDTIISKLKPHE